MMRCGLDGVWEEPSLPRKNTMDRRIEIRGQWFTVDGSQHLGAKLSDTTDIAK